MSGNHYSKQVAELEQMLDRKIGQLQILEQKNSELKQRERALQTAIGSRTGALLASKSLLESSLSGGGGGNASPSDSASTASGNCLCALPTACAAAQVRDDGRQQSQSFSNVSAAGSVLSELQEREDEVQRMLDKVGGSSTEELYSTWLLRRATANPARVASHLAMSLQYRIAHYTNMVPKLGVLLPKYDTNGPSTRVGSAKQQLDNIVDDLTEKLLVVGLWDPPELRLQHMLLNADTMQPEPYPDQWWHHVAQALDLTEEQKAAIRVGDVNMKGQRDRFLARHQELAARVAALQQRKREQLRAFHRQADCLPQLILPARQPQTHLEKQLCMQQKQQPQWAQQSPQQQQHSAEQLQQLQQLQLQYQQRGSPQQQRELMQLQLQHVQQQRLLQQQITHAQEVEQHFIQQTQQEMLQQLPDDGDECNLDDFELNVPLISCGTLAAAAVAALAQDAANDGSIRQQQQQVQQQQQYPTQQQFPALIPEEQLQSQQPWQQPQFKLEDVRMAALDSPNSAEQLPTIVAVDNSGWLPQRAAASFTFGQQQQQQLLASLAVNRCWSSTGGKAAQEAVAAPTAAEGLGSITHSQQQHLGRDACPADAGAVDAFNMAGVQLCGLNDSFTACSADGGESVTSQGGFAFQGFQHQQQQQQQQRFVSSGIQQQQQLGAWSAGAGLSDIAGGGRMTGSAARLLLMQQGQQQLEQYEQQLRQQGQQQQQQGGAWRNLPPLPSPAAGYAQLAGVGTSAAADDGLKVKQTLAAAAAPASREASTDPTAAADDDDDVAGGVDNGGSSTRRNSLFHSHALSKANTAAQQELLLEVFSHEHKELEQQLDKINRQIKLLMHLQFFNLVNILSKQQLAKFYIQSFPFYPDSLSLCEALDEMGW